MDQANSYQYDSTKHFMIFTLLGSHVEIFIRGSASMLEMLENGREFDSILPSLDVGELLKFIYSISAQASVFSLQAKRKSYTLL